MAERQSDPRRHAIEIKGMLDGVMGHVREDASKVEGSGVRAVQDHRRGARRSTTRIARRPGEGNGEE